MIKDIKCKIKNRADNITLKKAWYYCLSDNKKQNKFFDSLSYNIQKIFINFGYIPKSDTDANNFLNSISNINDKKQYDISYAFEDIPKTKHFVLTNETYKFALYPKIWKNLALEDRLVTLNFAYKDLLKYYNLNKNYRLTWVDNLFIHGQNGHIDRERHVIAINLRDIIEEPTVGGIKIYSTLAHEANHIKQNNIAKSILTLPDKSNLSIYDQRLNAHNALIVSLNNRTKGYFLDDKYLEKFNNIEPEKWKKYLNINYYKYDYLEMSSINAQIKALKNISKECYEYFDDDYTKDTHINYLINFYKNYNLIDNLKAGDIKDCCIKKTDYYNQLRTLCGFVYDRFIHLNNVLLNDLTSQNPLSQQTKNSIAKEQICCKNILTHIYQALIDGYYIKGHIPKTFNKKLFDYINIFLDKKQETIKDTVNYHNMYQQQVDNFVTELNDIICFKQEQTIEQNNQQQSQAQDNNNNNNNNNDSYVELQ